MPRPDGLAELAAGHGQPCRFCGRLAYATDAAGPLHTCCEYWQDEIAAGKDCPACVASRMSRARRFDYTLVDRRAIASGRRRSSAAAYRQAQREEQAARSR